jgi:hypothetical protein
VSAPDLAHLEPVFLRDLTALLEACAAHGSRYRIISGYRSLDEQAALYRAYKAGGPKAAAPGESAHNFGLGADCVHIIGGSTADWEPAAYGLLNDLASRYSLETLAAIQDYGHVQRIGWRLFHDVQAGHSTK